MKTKAAILEEIGKPLVIHEIDIPPLQSGQVLVKILCTGLCHSQLNEIKGNKGEDKFLPHTLGHEASGIVQEIGQGITKVKIGDYVVLTWIKGKGMDAPSSSYLNNGTIINSGAISTFMEYAVISENRLIKIDQQIPPSIGALLGCAFPTGAGIIKNNINPKHGSSIAIFGIGGIGMSALLQAQATECNPIIAIDIVDEKLEKAKLLGATHTINAKNENVIKALKSIILPGVDAAVECTGNKTAMENAFEAIRPGGVTVIAGNLKLGEKISIDPFELIKGKKIIGTRGGKTNPDDDIPYYAQEYLNGHLRLDTLISQTYSLDQINQAFSDLEHGKVIRAMISFHHGDL